MSVKQRKNGNWEVRYRDLGGIHRSKTFKSKKDALVYERNIRAQIYKGEYFINTKKKITTEQLFKEYLDTKRNFKPKTKNDLESLWNHIIGPSLANIQINSINAEIINRWIHKCVYGEQAITSANRMNKAIGYLTRMFDFAIDLGYLNRNPLVKPSGKPIRVDVQKSTVMRPAKVLTPEQLKAVASYCGEYEDMVLLKGFCGLRWAELVGIRVKDFSSDCKKLHIRRTLSEVRGVFHETTTKTGSDRTIYIPDALAERIKKKIQGERVDDLVFCNDKGKPLSNSNFRARVFNPALKSANLPKITIHDLRHTAASIAINGGARITAVSRMLGHSDTAMTLRVYSHFFEDDLVDLSEFLNKKLQA